MDPNRPFVQCEAVQLPARNSQNGANVTQMFVRSALTIVLELAKNDIFGRGHSDAFGSNGIGSDAAKGPGVKFVAPRKIEIRF